MPHLASAALYLVGDVPLLLVLLVGVILVFGKGAQLPRGAKALALSGFGLLLVETVLGMVWTLMLPQVLMQHWSYATKDLVLTAVNITLRIAVALAIGLLAGAVVAGRQKPQIHPQPHN